MSGTLYVVATPIGNLEDITLRALRVLGAAAVIAAEDTRRTAVLLTRYDIRTPTTSFHEHNERKRVPALIARLRGGEDVALVSDAGTPGISDPGVRLVAAALEAGIPVQPVPGPSAAVAALVASGMATHEFTFMGFGPARSKDKEKWVGAVMSQPRTVVFFDSPRRLRDTLTRMAQRHADRRVAVARELTKMHEESVIGPINAVINRLNDRIIGEVTVVVAAAASDSQLPVAPGVPGDVSDEPSIVEEFYRTTNNGRVSRREAIRLVARRRGLTSREVYRAVEEAKKLGNLG